MLAFCAIKLDDVSLFADLSFLVLTILILYCIDMQFEYFYNKKYNNILKLSDH